MTASEGNGGVRAEDVDEWFEQEEEEASEAPVPVDPAEKYAKSQLRVVRETKDYQLDYLQHALRPGHELIDISPAYQRRLRWPNKKKSLLIESFLLNIPVPPVFLFERDYNEYEVIDGRQRIEAISSFLSNGFALSGLKYWSELNRMRFDDLPTVLRKGLLRRSLPAVILLAETSMTGIDGLDLRTALFDRLNTGGIRLNPQELRNALYPGNFNALLIELARSKPFTDTWGIPPYSPEEESSPPDELLKNPLYSQLADSELVLRFFALKDAITSGKTGPLKVLLDKFMQNNRELSDADLQEMESEYLTSLNRLIWVFGSSTFRLKENGRLSRPLYDALMIALSRSPEIDTESNPGGIRHALDQALTESKKYDILVGRGNTIGAVHDRVKLADEILRSGS